MPSLSWNTAALTDATLIILSIGLPLIAALMEWVGDTGMVERHHSHHDTYVISGIMSRVLVMVMLFMGLLGVMLGWLCMVGVFSADETVMLAFFSSFVIVIFVVWFVMHRYLVCTFDDHMEVVPLLGRRRTIRYEDIESLRWTSSSSLGGSRSISVIVDGKVVAQLLGTIDVEQILLRMNRNDALELGPVS